MTHTTLPTLPYPESRASVLGALEYYTSDDARAECTDAERLAAIDAVMAQHQAARAELCRCCGEQPHTPEPDEPPECAQCGQTTGLVILGGRPWCSRHRSQR